MLHRFLICIILTIFIYRIGNCQYISSDGEVKIDMMVHDLNALEWLSPAQDSLSKKMILSLAYAMKENTIISKSKEKRTKLIIALNQLGTHKGSFYFLSPTSRNVYNKQNDTISNSIKILSANWVALYDSINKIENQFIGILESKTETNESKKYATNMLGKTSNLEVVNYLFANESKMRFGTIPMNQFYELQDDDCWGCERTGILDLFKDKVFIRDSLLDTGSNRNWIIFPFLIQYWGNSDFDTLVSSAETGNRLERLTFWRLTERYKKPWLLYEFMVANVENPDTKIMKEIGESMKDKKNRFEKQEKNKKK